ncbi:T9SS type A sorting domain-containing protein [Reichenbachiella sp.]|uniref:DUF5018 domain-containing protein n=2 Tax=Reichenbachiella sp. TaxID=2184521 RepID=UPI00326662DC
MNKNLYAMKINETIKPIVFDKLKEHWVHIDKALLTILLSFMFMMLALVANSQSLSYRSSFDLTSGGSFVDNFLLPVNGDVTFSTDGSKMYLLDAINDQILQYTPTNPFDIAAGGSDDGTPFSIAAQETSASGLAFSSDGSKMFVVGIVNDQVHQYNLNTPFDITAGATYVTSYSVAGQDSSPFDLDFSKDGSKMFILGASGKDVNQYNLASPFDITSGVTFEGTSVKYSGQINNARTIAFSQDGKKVYILGITHDAIAQYSLTTPFDVTSGMSYDNVQFYVGANYAIPGSMTFSGNGASLFVAGSFGGTISVGQYQLNTSIFTESDVNDGSLPQSAGVQISGDTFTNAGGTLTSGVDFTVDNLPTGLTPVISVGDDGSYGLLSFSGSATNHQNVNDLASLQFTFQNSAFVSDDAAGVANATAANSAISVDFNDNNPELTYDFAYDFNPDITFETSHLISIQENSPQGLKFSSDGMKLFVIGESGREVNQYSLQHAFDISSVLFDGLYSVITQEFTPKDLAFSNDGMSMFVIGSNQRRIFQYSLASAFDVTSGVTYDDVSLNVGTEETTPQGISFNNDGTKLYVVGSSGRDINQYTLTTPFSIASGVSFDGSPFSVAGESTSPFAITFNGDGTEMLIAGLNEIHLYQLTTPFDVTSGVSYTGVTLDISSIGSRPTGIVWSGDGTKLLIVESDTDRVHQYDAPTSNFEENAENLGGVDGSMIVKLVDDFFVNAGGTLLESTHFTIPNKPTGLTASISVDANGQDATLSFTGAANNHQAINAVNSLTVNFLNVAFVNSNAADVVNAVNQSTGTSMEFHDNNKALQYGSAFELVNATLAGTSGITGDGHPDFAFNADGSIMFLLFSDDRIYELILTDKFDVSGGFDFGSNFSVGSQDAFPTAFTFSSDGMKLFMTGGVTHAVHQYSLTSTFDITTASFEGSYGVSNEGGSPVSVAFNEVGSKMFVFSSANDKIHQYSLTTNFDITSSVAYDDISFNLGFEDDFVNDITFANGGKKLYTVGNVNDQIYAYDLVNPYDLASMSFSESLDVSDQQFGPSNPGPLGVTVRPDGGMIYLLSRSQNEFAQYDLDAGGFNEASANNGAVEGGLTIYIQDETFTNAGGTLTYTTDYTLGNLPTGLSSSLNVAADGFSATLTLSGIANVHQDANDVSSLGFNFNNSAFVGGNASEVDNATSAESGIGIDFVDNNSNLSYGYSFSIENGASEGYTVDIAEESNPQGLAFNGDGTKVYIAGNATDQILQYSLLSPYRMDLGMTLDGTLAMSGHDITLLDMTFSPSGDKLYVPGIQNHGIYQFSLSTPFDITTGVTYDGTPSSNPTYPRAVTFNDDGTTIFLVAGLGSGQRIYEYGISVAYDVTSTWTLRGNFDPRTQEPNPTGLLFSDHGFTMLIVGLNRSVHSYRLTVPYNITNGVTYDQAFNFASIVVSSSGMAFDNSGSMLYITDAAGGGDITEFNINTGGFNEVLNNGGGVEGDMTIRVFDATFANSGGNLTEPTDYAVSGIPSGLTSNLAVAADGLSAVLTLSGMATAHQNVNDVSNLIFTFENSAFTNDVSLIENASAASSNLGIDFSDNHPGLIYGDAFDVTNGVSYSETSFSIGDEALDLTFSPDGTKMFIVDFFDNVEQYTLANPFDLSSGVTMNTPSFGLTAEEVSTGVTFSSDGMKMFVVSNLRLIHQYSLTTPFDITSGVSDDGNPLNILNQETGPAAIFFKPDGTKLFVLGGGSDAVNQYSLTNPFDITSGVIFDGNPYSIVSEESNAQGLAFSKDGRKMHIVGLNDEVYQYSLAFPYDVTAGVTYVGTPFNFASEDGQATGLAFSANGDRMFITGRDNDEVFQYDLDVGHFNEVALNDGNVAGTTTLYIADDLFSNAGSTLTLNSDYSISNLPVGLIPTLNVAADGLSASLTISGQVTEHQAINSVAGLEFTFQNSAFVTNPASNVAGAVAANSNLGIIFRDNNPAITYGDFYDFTFASHDGLFDVATQDDTPTNVTFNADGSKMFVTGRRNDAIYQYGLAAPFVVTSGVSYEGLLDISVETRDAMDLQFSPDGMTLLVLSDNISSNFGSVIAQYDLTLAFDITSGVTYSGHSYDLSSQMTQPSGFTFNGDGTKVFITNGFHASEWIYYYTFNNAYDISGGLTYDGNLRYEVESESLYDLSFNGDGTSLFVLYGALSDQIDELKLDAPYDLTGTINLVNTFSVSSQEDFPQGFIFGPGGSRLYVVGATGDEVNQYTLTNDGFEENSANDGNIDGSLTIRLVDDFFANQGGSLSSPNDFTITNLPTGLTSSLAVAGDGLSAVLTLGGNASSHLNSEDVGSLQFTFENSAFVNYQANEVNNATTAESSVGIDFIASAETDILTFMLTEETGSATIDATNHTIDIEVVFGTDVITLAPSLTLSDGAQASPVSGAQVDFTSAQVYTVTAEDGATVQDWDVTVTVAPNTENDITVFTFSEINGSAAIDNGAHTITAEAVAGTNISAISPDITVSVNAAISPLSGTEQDFSTTVTYTVTAEDGTPQDWDVSITEAIATPTDIILSSTTVDEGSSPGTIVGSLLGVDANFNEGFTFAVVDEFDNSDDDYFQVIGSNLVTTDFESLNFESNSSFFFYISVEDDDGETLEKEFNITLNDINEAPTDIMLSNNNINESNPAGTVIGILSTEDVDNGDTHTYTVADGCGVCRTEESSNFEIVGNELRSKVVFDFETLNGYAIDITSTDAGGLSITEGFVISINDIPASVTAVTLDVSTIDENEAPSSLIGTFSTSGEDLSGSFTYNLVSGTGDDDNASFTTSGGQLFTAESFNFEVKNSYSILVMTDDGNGHTLDQQLTISIGDVSESTDTNILTFVLADQTGPAAIDNINNTVEIEVAHGTDLTSLTPSITISAGASITPSGSQDFSSTVTYTITAEEPTSTEEWQVTVTEAPNNETDILTFVLPEQTGDATIDRTNHTVAIEVANGTNVTSLEPTITLSAGAEFSPSGVQDFSVPVSYTITGEDGITTQDWIVTVTEAPSSETDILTFVLTEETEEAAINATNHTVVIEVANSTDVTNLTPTITLSSGATVSPEGAQDFTNPVIYTVTAEDGSTTQDWTVTATVEPGEVTAIDDSEYEVRVYPNPASDWLTVISPNTSTSNIQLFDLRGGLLMAQKLEGQTRISLQDLENGLYLLKLTNDEITTTTKILIRR